jgi:hypothetical protein
MQCIHQCLAVASLRGKLAAVEHTFHMSCGRIGDPQTMLLAASCRCRPAFPDSANREPLPPWLRLIDRELRGASPGRPSTSLVYAPSWGRLQGSSPVKQLSTFLGETNIFAATLRFIPFQIQRSIDASDRSDKLIPMSIGVGCV